MKNTKQKCGNEISIPYPVDESANLLNFRFGFLFHRNSMSVKSTKALVGWSRQVIGQFTLWVHPQTKVHFQHNLDNTLLVIGDMYSLDGDPVDHALHAILEGGLSPHVDRIGGRFAMILINGNQFEVTHDAFGSRSIFYLDSKPVVSSHAALMALSYDIGRCELITEFMKLPEYRNRSVRYMPGDKTVYQNIFALVPNNSYDGERTRRYWPRTTRSDYNQGEFISAAQKYLERFSAHICENFDPIFGITGGVDSRAIFCAFSEGFEGVSWTRYNLKDSERPVIKKIVEKLSISHQYLDHRLTERSEIANAAKVSSGKFRGRSLLTESMAHAYQENKKVAFIRGYGGEIMRGFPAYFRMKDFSVESMVECYGSSQRKIKNGERYLEICHSIFNDYHSRANYVNIEKFDYKPMDIFYWEHRMGMWGATMLNEMDPAMPSFAGFNSRPLFEIAFGVEDKRRLTKDFLHKIVVKCNADLANIPCV